MGRRFVDQIWLNQRMQASDDRYARELQRRLPRLAPEVLPYASVEIVPAPEPSPITDVEKRIEEAQRGR